ncbi:MAG: hypothetical protein WD906_01095 [Anaerolineales bacterium]
MTKTTPQEAFEWWDAWILLAIIYATRSDHSASLAAIIGVGDYINHAILTRGELETGLRRLIGAGLIARADDGFLPGEPAQRFWARLEAQGGAVMNQLQSTASFLGARNGEPGGLPNPSTQDYVTKEQFEAAADQYHRSARASQIGIRKQHDA